MSSILFLLSLYTNAQVYPVQVTPQVIPPYSLKLSDYATASSDKLVVNLLLIDVNEFNRQVGLRLFIESNDGVSIQSRNPVVGALPIALDGGIPLRLTNADLQAYFALQNLSGVTPQRYNTTLPEGLYRFCFEVFDFFTGQTLSRKSCAIAYLVLNDPPFLNLPNRGEIISERIPQNIIFQWTPRHLNATNVQYEFTLAEVWDRQMDPQAAFLASRPLYQTTTFATTLLYGPAEPALLPDKTYAWRVRALVSDGISETSVFRNDGYSEIYHFIHTAVCDAPSYLLAENKTPTTQQLLWQGTTEHRKYRVQYRKQGVKNAVWFEVNAFNERATLHHLEPGTTYEFRVGGQCLEGAGFSYSQINEFTTMLAASDAATYNCGITPEIVITNQKPLESLVINDVFTAGDFPVTVKYVGAGNADGVTTATGDGVYSGWGFITVPYLQNTKIKVSFQNIRINSDYQLIAGVVFTDYDENWDGVDDVGNEIEAVVSFGDAIVEALNLDISKETKDKITQIIDAITDQISEESLPDEVVASINEATNAMKEATDKYYQAQEDLENAVTDDEKKAAQEQLDATESDFKEAQSSLEEGQKEVEKFRKEVVDLLKKSIYELYRAGRDQKEILLTTYIKNYDKVIEESFTSDKIVYVDEVEIETTIVNDSNKAIDDFYDSEVKLAMYLFSMLLEESEDAEILNKLIEKSKEIGIDLLQEIKVLKSNQQTDREIIDFIKKKLIDSYKLILINYKI